MFRKIIEWIKHEHHFVKIGFRMAEDDYERYSIRKYKCTSCGKETWVDGRRDPYF